MAGPSVAAAAPRRQAAAAVPAALGAGSQGTKRKNRVLQHLCASDDSDGDIDQPAAKVW